MVKIRSHQSRVSSQNHRHLIRRRRVLIESLEDRLCLSTVPGLYGIGMVTSTSEVYQLRFFPESDKLVPYQLGTLTEAGSVAPPARDDAVLATTTGGEFLCVADNQLPGSLGLPSMLRQTDISVFESDADLSVTNLGEIWMTNPLGSQPATLDVRLNALEWSPAQGNQPAVLFGAGFFGHGQSTSHAIFTLAPETQQATPIFDLTGVGTSAGDIAFDLSGNLYLSLDGGDLLQVDLSTLGSPTPTSSVYDLPPSTPNFEALLPYEPGETLIGIAEQGDYHVITLATSEVAMAGSLRNEGDGLDVGESVYGATISFEDPIDLGAIDTVPIQPADVVPRLDQLWYEFDIAQAGDLTIDLSGAVIPGRTWMILYDGSAEPSVVTTGATQITRSVNSGESYYLHIVDLQHLGVPDLTFSVSTGTPNEFDFGDAPATYGTLLVDNGARHTETGLTLGPDLDVEIDGQPSANASGDGDDENGVRFLSTLLASANSENLSSVLVNASSNAKLDAWIDFNGNGVFDHPAEHLFDGGSVALDAGDNVMSFGIPSATVVGDSYARFRVSSAGALSPTGVAVDGEVEDYVVEIADAGVPQHATIQMHGMGLTMRSDGSNTLFESGPNVIFRAASNAVELVAIVGTTGDDAMTIDAANSLSMPVGGMYYTGEGGADSLKVTGDFDLNITEFGNTHLVGVSIIDLTDLGATTLTLDDESVFNADAHTIEVRLGEQDTIDFTPPAQWLLGEPVIRDGRFMQSAQMGSSIVLVDGSRQWQNPIEVFDVTNDGQVTARDALLIINELGREAFHDPQTSQLQDATTVVAWPGSYYDVTGDGMITALDALRVINQLARISASASQVALTNQALLDPIAWAASVDSSLVELFADEERDEHGTLF